MRFLLLFALLVIPAAGEGRILLLAPASKGFSQAISALKANLNDFDTKYLEISEHTKSQDIQSAISQYVPNAIVLFDNKSVRAYRQYLIENPTVQALPVIALMALQVEDALENFSQYIGISYEIPAVTTISRLRSLIKDPIRKVGVVYRASMEAFYLDHQKLCQIEHIELIGFKVSNEGSPGNELRRGLDRLVRENQVDAIWILNDNLLLTPRLFQEVWSPFMRAHRIPGIVGVETLVQPKLQFALYAALPDPAGLGAQAANLVYEIADNNWKVIESRVEKPLSIIQIWNSIMAEKVSTPRPEVHRLVDKVLE